MNTEQMRALADETRQYHRAGVANLAQLALREAADRIDALEGALRVVESDLSYLWGYFDGHEDDMALMVLQARARVRSVLASGHES